ncbi:hypothetical protein B0T17DRAFT_617389 [Bombardia bombarda]|uniref:RRM domain-containing protein n=1 Tax=Bombardia bombarda TaxID=252184 RepID=A0AA39X121_9PEZI|nr:hypothetical protein B0T17DRAFT_617389 [Bombardia bombarda]
MTGQQSPNIVATTNLSPISPAPIPLHNSSPALVPKLQDHAATTDVATPTLDHHPAISYPPPAASQIWAPAAMGQPQDSAAISDTIVVGGDYSDDSDDSLDAYGEDDDGQAQKNESDSGIDDYARTFDSPTDQPLSEIGEAQAQPDVSSKASESMNNSSAPDTTMKSQSPVAPTSAISSAPSLTPTHGSAQGPSSAAPSEHAVSESLSESLPASPIASPSDGGAAAAPALSVASHQDLAPTPSHAPAPTAVASASASASVSENEDDGAVDIQKLVDDITARAAVSPSSTLPPAPAPAPAPAQTQAPAPAQAAAPQATPASAPQPAPAVLTAPHSASLPPKPSVSQHLGHLPAIPPAPAFQSRTHNNVAPLTTLMPITNPATPRISYLSTGAPGTTREAISSLPPPPPPASYNASQSQPNVLSPNFHHMRVSEGASTNNFSSPSTLEAWELFQADERRYTAEAKWERFPINSRIFIGNLSSDKVSKREVFDIFHRYGRLAQISLKSAFGFVQYHTAEEAAAAMQNVQGTDLGGRRIHLELTRDKKKPEQRERSPERRNQRGGRGTDRYDGRDQGRRRDDYRPPPPVRSPSPLRRGDPRGSRDGFYPRDREQGSAMDRRRSRSPPRFGRFEGGDPYRRRSPSPHRRTPSNGDGPNYSRRSGSNVPDVQFLLLQEISKDFVSWIQRAFHDRGLKTDVMHLNPRFREHLVQQQVLEGVHAIIDLDLNAQMHNKISIQVFSRPAGGNVSFNLYQGLEPATAAELVLREKNQTAAQLAQAQARPVYPPNNYNNNPYHTAEAPAGYPYQYAQAPAPPAQVQQQMAPAPDLASIVGNLDNPALQAFLASLQSNAGASAIHQSAAHGLTPVSMPPTTGPSAPQIDLNALLNNLRSAAAVPAAAGPVAGYPGLANYGSAAAAYLPVGGNTMSPTAGMPNGAAVGMMGGYGGDTAQHVQTIIDQLKRAAQ